MSGLLFVVCVPTAEFEKQLLQTGEPEEAGPSRINHAFQGDSAHRARREPPLPMEKILEELLKKLNVEHVVWCDDKNNNYYQVFFPVAAGDPCENCLHCLTELGIGKKLNSVVSVVPCSVFHQGLEDGNEDEEDDEREPAQKKAWNNFVQSIRSKLTVQQVVDGVRGGAECSFDYLLLILTADMVAAVGLVENNSVNIVAAMLISPLMGPIMAGTFGTVIADKKLQKIGVRSELIGLFMSLIFGFIFGLLVGTTQSPWGYGDWPTEEMKARGTARSLWIGILWALPSGTGVALALLQGSAGPLIGVAISASLLPPAVNCGIMWGLACIVLIYDDVKLPHLKGEPFKGNTSYVNMYSPHLPRELAAMGIISFCLTLINICCIFITAIIVLKIKEVAAPYTSSPDLRRFWEYDIRVARDTNRATMQQVHQSPPVQPPPKNSTKQSAMEAEELGATLEAAVKEAVDDDTFRKVKRVSYAHSSADVMNAVGLGGNKSEASMDPAMLDQLITTLIGLQRTQPGLTRMRSRSMRHGSTRSAGPASTRASWILGHMQGQNTGRQSISLLHGSNSGLPTILETHSIRKGSTPSRPLSLSERALSLGPALRTMIGGAAQRLNAATPSEDNMETVSLTNNHLP